MKDLHRILLRDEKYRAWDQQCGGIFLSANRAPSVIATLLQCHGATN